MNIFYNLMHSMIICIIIKMHCKRLLQMQDLHGVCTAARGAPTTRHGTLEDPTALLQRSHSARSNTLCKRQPAAFVLSISKTNAAAWRSRRLHSAHTALLATAQRAPRWSAFLERRGNAVRTPLWCDRGFRVKYTMVTGKRYMISAEKGIKQKRVIKRT